MGRFRGFAFVLGGFAVAAFLMHSAHAQATDPNNVPFDPHPLGVSRANAPGDVAGVFQDDKAVYLVRGNQLFRVPKSAFHPDKVDSVTIGER